VSVRRVLALLLLAAVAPACTAAAPACRPALPASALPGALVAGCVGAGERVEYAGRQLRVDAEGRFVFGIARDARGAAVLQVQGADGSQREQRVAIAPRSYRVEHVDGLPQQTVTPDPAIAARIAREQAGVAAARERDDARSDFAAGFARPLQGRISGEYGSQRVLNGVPRSPHMGLDIAARTGTPVLAPAAGTVSFAASDLYLTGGTLLIDHGHGLSSSYLHLSAVEVETGERVERGQRIGAVGATGRASGPHLHWGVNWFEVRLDPALLPAAQLPGW